MLWSIIVSAVFFAALAMFLVRLADQSGIALPQNKVTAFITENKFSPSSDGVPTANEYIKVFAFALGFRIAVFVIAWLALGIFSDARSIGFTEFCEKWNLWDAPHYIEIAQNGYGQHVEDGQHLFLVFFPLYPWLMRIPALIIRNYAAAGLLTSFLCYSAGCVLMYKLVSADYSRSIAAKSVMFLSISPFAFFFGGIMTESLFFLMIIAVMLAIRSHKWWLAGVLGILAALTRSVGIFMIIPAFAEWLISVKPAALIKDKQWKQLGKRFLGFLPAAVMVIGILIYLYINYSVEGDPFVFMKYQNEHWSQHLQFFGKTIRMLFERSFSSGERLSFKACLFIPGLLSITAAAAAILYGTRRLRTSYSAFMLIYFVFNVSASWPLSICRYLSCLFPAFWLMAWFTDKHKELEIPIAAASAILFGIYLAGYITCHQIM